MLIIYPVRRPSPGISNAAASIIPGEAAFTGIQPLAATAFPDGASFAEKIKGNDTPIPGEAAFA
jgi:hypothetical protein